MNYTVSADLEDRASSGGSKSLYKYGTIVQHTPLKGPRALHPWSLSFERLLEVAERKVDIDKESSFQDQKNESGQTKA